MLTPDDRRAIEDLFDKLRNVETQAPPPDREANEMIRRAIERQPNAPYFMAQAIVVQQQALEQAQRRIAELEDALERARSGDLEGAAVNEGRSRGPWNRNSQYDEQRDGRWGGRGLGGGGFLAGAMQTALGVTGGLLLGSALGSLFGAGEANADEPGQADTETQADDNSQEPDAGSDMGDDSGFDMGGDF